MSQEPHAPAGTILVGDDEPPVLRVVQRILTRVGFTVLPAEDGQAAVDAFKGHEGAIDLVILDVSMPKLSGVEAAIQKPIRHVCQVRAAWIGHAATDLLAQPMTVERRGAEGAVGLLKDHAVIDARQVTGAPG